MRLCLQGLAPIHHRVLCLFTDPLCISITAPFQPKERCWWVEDEEKYAGADSRCDGKVSRSSSLDKTIWIVDDR